LLTVANCTETIDFSTSEDYDLSTHLLKADKYDMINAGLTIALGDVFLNKVLKEILPAVFKMLEKEYKLGQTIEVDLEMFKVILTSPKLIVNEISFGEDGTKVDLYDKNNSFGFHIQDSVVDISMKYSLILDPPILDDDGTLNIGYTGLSIDVILAMLAKKDNPKAIDLEISESYFKVAPKNVKIEIDNSNDFDKLLITVVNSIKAPIVNLISQALSEYLQQLADLVEGLIPGIVNLSGIEIDLAFAEIPDVTVDDFIIASWVGKVTSEQCQFENTRMLPKYIPDGKDLQLFISDYTLRSAL